MFLSFAITTQSAPFDVEYIYGFVWWGGLHAKSMTSYRAEPSKMAGVRYHGNVMTTTRWRLYVTMETSWQQQDGGYALLWKRYPNIQITSPFAVEDVYTELVIDVFYIFNSTVVDWTCYIIFFVTSFNVYQKLLNIVVCWYPNTILTWGKLFILLK